MRDCLVSYSSRGREDYNVGLLRLIDSAIEHWNGDMLFYSKDHNLSEYRGVKINKGLPQPKEINSCDHSIIPYQFKIAIIQQAIEMGYERVVWLDSSMIINKDIIKLFGENGITVFHNLGQPLYKYISDRACEILGVDDKMLIDIEQIWGGALMFDFTNKNAEIVFNKVKIACELGAFSEGTSTRAGFVAHRHDQAVISVLVHGRCNMQPYGKIVCPPHDTNFEYGNDIYLLCKGI